MSHAAASQPLTAIFLEPTGPLRDALLGRKAHLERAMPGQAYCSHPPHCTLLFGDYGPPAAWFDALRAAVHGVPPFPVETEGWQLFPNDLLAGGGTTVAFRVRLGPQLGQLQRIVAETLAPHRPPAARAAAAGHPLAAREPFATSLGRYGFPFVGEHWIPHFTIGSPRVGAETPLVRELSTGSPCHAFRLGEISVWRVAGEEHTRQAGLPLAGPAV